MKSGKVNFETQTVICTEFTYMYNYYNMFPKPHPEAMIHLLSGYFKEFGASTRQKKASVLGTVMD